MTLEDCIKHYESIQKRYMATHNGKMCEITAMTLSCLKWRQFHPTCHNTDEFGNPVNISFGNAELSPHNFILSEVHENCKVEILKCQTCGEISIGWYAP